MFKKSNKGRHLRKKTIDENDEAIPPGGEKEKEEREKVDDDTKDTSVTPKPSSSKTTLEVKKDSSKTLLSFEDEEQTGDDYTNIAQKIKSKKEKKTRKPSKAKSSLVPRQSPATTITPSLPKESPTATSYNSSHGIYTPDKLAELKQSSLFLGGVSAKNQPKEGDIVAVEDMEEDEEIATSQQVVQKINILDANQAEALEVQEEEEDEDFQRWEMEQIKKGGGRPFSTQPIIPKKKKKLLPLGAVPLQPAPRISINEMQQQLNQAVQEMELVHRKHQEELDRNSMELESARIKLQNLDKEYKTASDQYMFFQDIKYYISNLCDCLAEKAPLIEDAEEQLLTLEIAYADRMSSSATEDQLWNDAPTPRPDEEYTTARDQITTSCDNVFADASEEFSSIRSIKQRFEEWKFKHPQTYQQAYCPLSIPQLFAPFVRLEIYKWNPLKTAIPIDKMNWFQELFAYGIQQGVQPAADDPDLDLVPSLVEKVVVPRCVKLLTHLWNPRSVEANHRAIELMNQLLIYIDPKSDLIKELLSAVLVSIQGVTETLPPSIKSEKQLGLELKLLRNIAEWFGFQEHNFPVLDHLGRIILDSLLNMRILPYMKQLQSYQMIVTTLEMLGSTLPPAWFREGKLTMMHHFVGQLCNRIPSEQQPQLLPRVIKILGLFQKQVVS